jgi:hypothetical protein
MVFAFTSNLAIILNMFVGMAMTSGIAASVVLPADSPLFHPFSLD